MFQGLLDSAQSQLKTLDMEYTVNSLILAGSTLLLSESQMGSWNREIVFLSQRI